MRLGTCIALELLVAAGAVGGVGFGVGRVTDLAGDYVGAKEAVAATANLPAIATVPAPERLPIAHIPSAPIEIPRPRAVATIFGAPDDELLAPLGAATVTRLKLNHGGTSLSVRLDFANGARAAFKPEQIHPQSDPRREIAAYRLDRLLGIGRVPPAKAVTIPVADLIEAADPSHRRFVTERFKEEATIRRGGIVRGELSWWVPEIKFAKIDSHLVDDKDGKKIWAGYLKVGVDMPAEVQPLLAQIAAVVLFDVLIDNPDRWSGGNTLMSPDGQLYFMDNTMSFSRFGYGHESNLLALRRIERFPKQLVERMRALTAESIAAAIHTGDDHGLAPLVEERELNAVIRRRDNMLLYIDALIEKHGEAAVLAFP